MAWAEGTPYCLILPDHVFSSFCHHRVKAKQACPTSIFMSLPEEPGTRWSVDFHGSTLDIVYQFSHCVEIHATQNKLRRPHTFQQTAPSRALVYVVISRRRAGCREGENVVRGPPYMTSYSWCCYPTFYSQHSCEFWLLLIRLILPPTSTH